MHEHGKHSANGVQVREIAASASRSDKNQRGHGADQHQNAGGDLLGVRQGMTFQGKHPECSVNSGISIPHGRFTEQQDVSEVMQLQSEFLRS